MKEIYCSNCKRYLCKVSFGEVVIKCSSCKEINTIRLDSYKHLLTLKPTNATIKP